ncbi:hypothetical protein WA158_008179 [Blastocystis sp. Blastoise]
MAESEKLINPILKQYNMREIFVDLSKLYSLLNLKDAEKGLDKEYALGKLQSDGSNIVSKPLNIPSWLCCCKCLEQYSRRMTKYNAMLPTNCKVLRSGETMVIDYVDLVCGDVVYIRPGMIIPADIRVFEYKGSLQVDRSSLLTESPILQCTVNKSNEDIEHFDPQEVYLQPDLLFMGSRVITGEGKGVVIRTGDNTLWGCICAYVRKECFL